MCAKKQKLNKVQLFEQELFHSLKYHGYLLPDNFADIQRLDEFYGDTEIEVPENLQPLDLLQSDSTKKFVLDLDFSSKIAAFSPKDLDQFGLNEDLNSEENGSSFENLDDEKDE